MRSESPDMPSYLQSSSSKKIHSQSSLISPQLEKPEKTILPHIHSGIPYRFTSYLF